MGAAPVAIVAAESLLSSAVSTTGFNSGERDAGLTVAFDSGIRMKSSITPDVTPEVPWVAESIEEPNKAWDKVRGEGSKLSKGDEPLLEPAELLRSFFISSTNMFTVLSRLSKAASSSLHLCSRASTSCRFRSREDWAARRLRRTRSTRRCSFSSSVLARFLVAATLALYRRLNWITNMYHTLEASWSWVLEVLDPMTFVS